MYLYLGGSIALPVWDIVGIFDLDTATVSKHSRDFLRQAQLQQRVLDAGEGCVLPKSFVLTGEHVYLSPFGSATLQARWASATLVRRKISES